MLGTEGDPVTLRCPVNHPKSGRLGVTQKKSWTRQNTTIAYLISIGSNVIVNNSFGDDNIWISTIAANLTIGRLETSYAGIYECKVEGYGAKEIKLTVKSKISNIYFLFIGLIANVYCFIKESISFSVYIYI